MTIIKNKDDFHIFIYEKFPLDFVKNSVADETLQLLESECPANQLQDEAVRLTWEGLFKFQYDKDDVVFEISDKDAMEVIDSESR